MKLGQALAAIITRPTWPLMILVTFLIAFGALTLTTLIDAAVTWGSKVNQYESWLQTEQPALCNAWDAECEKELVGTGQRSGTSDMANKYESVINLMLCKERGVTRNPELECMAKPSDTLFAHVAAIDLWRRIGDPGLALWLAILLPLSAARVVINEQQLGWRRLSLLIGGLAMPIAGMVAFLIDDEPGFVAVIALGGLICGLALPLLAKRALRWVNDGFSPSAELPTQPAGIDRNEGDQLEMHWRLSSMMALKILGAMAVLTFIVGLLAFGSDKAIATLVSSIAQIVVLVGLVGLIRWVHGLFAKQKK